uniref:Uncharacterized protein n=1 Tax=Panagrolaimus sp. ES5 TaxID=591445 RepID=A0AC34GV15_9BILA
MEHDQYALHGVNAEEEEDEDELQHLGFLLEILQKNSSNAFLLALNAVDGMSPLDFIPQPRLCRTFLPRRRFNPAQFFLHTGFSGDEAEKVLDFIGESIRRRTLCSHALTLSDVFVTGMAALRHGGDYASIGAIVGVHPSTVARVIPEYVNAVISKMSHFINAEVSTSNWKHHQQVFYRKYGLPFIIGALDGSLIPLRNIGTEKDR